jgi:hypothetical protein
MHVRETGCTPAGDPWAGLRRGAVWPPRGLSRTRIAGETAGVQRSSSPDAGGGPMQRHVLHHFGASLLSFSAIRVCHPGPVARQRSMTSSVRRIEISLFGFSDLGRPPLLTTSRANISSVSSGRSSYSAGSMTCLSTRFMSEPKDGADELCCTNRIADSMTPTPDGVMPGQPLARFEDGRFGRSGSARPRGQTTPPLDGLTCARLHVRPGA